MSTREPYRPERVGNLRERVELQQRTETEDEFGQPIVSWVALETVFARVEPLKGDEKTAAWIAGLATQRYTVHIRYRDDLSVLDRVVWNGTTLDIKAQSSPDERSRFLSLDCEAIAA